MTDENIAQKSINRVEGEGHSILFLAREHKKGIRLGFKKFTKSPYIDC